MTSLHMLSVGYCDNRLISASFKSSYKRTHKQVTAQSTGAVLRNSLPVCSGSRVPHRRKLVRWDTATIPTAALA